MNDNEMERDKGIIKEIQNGDIKDIMVVVGNEELSHSEETYYADKDPSQSNGKEAGDEKQCLVGNIELHPKKDSEHPVIGTPEEKGCFEPSALVSALSPDTDISRNELHIDLPIQSAFPEHSETSLGIQAEVETEIKLNGLEFDKENETTEKELNGGGMRMELVCESERNDEALNGEVCLTLESEIKKEQTNASSNRLELPQVTEGDDNDLDNLVIGTELPLEYGVKVETNTFFTGNEELEDDERNEVLAEADLDEGDEVEFNSLNGSFLLGPGATESEETGTREDQLAFIKELEIFHKERFLDFRPPRFYQEPLNLLKLWRSVVRLGGYEQVTSCKLWRQIGESFKPPKTCTTVSWTFRCFYEKALLEYEKYKLHCGELPYTDLSFAGHTSSGNQLGMASGSGRQRRDAAARAMQGWHSQRLLGNGEVGDPIIKDKNSSSNPKREKQLKSIGLLKRKKPSGVERAVKVARIDASDSLSEAEVIDIGHHPADWVKINVQRIKDCYEVYALIPGLLREEVRVQSDPVGRLVISGQPEHLENPWGVTPFKKVVSLPSRIDPQQTSAVVTLHGQLFVRVPYEPLNL